MIEQVIKYNGSVEDFDAEKFNRWAKYACKMGGNWSEIALEAFRKLPKIAKSSDIHEAMINVCYSKESIEYSRIAARLEVASLRKNMQRVLGLYPNKDSFSKIRNTLVDKGVWCGNTVPEVSECIEELYKEIKDVKLESWQVAQWGDKYLMKFDGVAVETPHIAAMGIGLGIHGDTKLGHDLVRNIIYGKVNLPTPILNGVRNGDFDGISCAVIESGDTVESIGVAEHLAMRLTAKKAGIGIRYNTRSKGASVKKGAVEHLGKQPIYNSLSSAVKTFTQVSRGGSATVAFDVIDPEVESIALWKSQRSDIENRIDKIDYSFAFNDAFLEAVVARKPWLLFDYATAPEVYESFYKDSVERYNEVVEGSKHKAHREADALELLKHLLVIRQETGRLYCLNVSRVNEHTPFYDNIKLSNLCVAPETLVLTDTGHEVISDLVGEEVNVWNGSEWSKVSVVKTSEASELITVNTLEGFSLECTPYHKFYVQRGFTASGYVEMVRAVDLKSGDRLIKLETTVIEGQKVLPKAWENGFYTGDGCNVNGKSRIYLYGDKVNLSHLFEDKSSVTLQDSRVYFYIDGLKDKFFIPDSSYTTTSRVNWFAGLLDSDGCLVRNGKSQTLQITSTEEGFLESVQLMLQTLGVQSKVVEFSEGGYYSLPANNGSGEKKLYKCRKAVRLLINGMGIVKLLGLGMKTNRLEITNHIPNRDASNFIRVGSVEFTGRISPTYCFTEPLKGMGVFNGILTGNCQEIMLPTKPYKNMLDLYSDEANIAGQQLGLDSLSGGETAFCVLAALVPSNITDEEYYEVAKNTVATLNVLIEKCPKMTPNHNRTIKYRKSLGVGVTGLAGLLYKNGLDYEGSGKSLEFVHDTMERHYHALLTASQELYLEGDCSEDVQGVDLDWLPIDTKRSKWDNKLDWESLRGKPRLNSVLCSIQPTESSSLVSNAENAVYPPRDKVVNKKSRKGIVQFISEGFEEGVNLKAWDVDPVTLSRYYGVIQDFTDQGISADTYFDPDKFDGGKKPMSHLVKEWVAHFRLGNKSMYYVNTRDSSGGGLQSVMQKEYEEDACTTCTL